MAKGKNKNGLSRKIMEKKENGSEINKNLMMEHMIRRFMSQTK